MDVMSEFTTNEVENVYTEFCEVIVKCMKFIQVVECIMLIAYSSKYL